jgi:hypothetical protein
LDIEQWKIRILNKASFGNTLKKSTAAAYVGPPLMVSGVGLWKAKGPTFEGVHLQVFCFAGETLEQAQRLAMKLGELSDAGDEGDKSANS